MTPIEEELLTALATADESYERLREGGRVLHFEIAGVHRIRVEMRDLEGNVLRELAPSEALAYAAGKDAELAAVREILTTDYAPRRDPVELVFALSADSDAPAAARGKLVGLRDALDGDVFSDLLLVVSELVTNAVRHAPAGPVTIRVHARGARDVSGEVVDPGEQGPPAGDAPHLDGGWGLQLVDAVASRWGVRAGTTDVWFEILR